MFFWSLILFLFVVVVVVVNPSVDYRRNKVLNKVFISWSLVLLLIAFFFSFFSLIFPALAYVNILRLTIGGTRVFFKILFL